MYGAFYFSDAVFFHIYTCDPSPNATNPVSANALHVAGTGVKYSYTFSYVFLISHTLNLESFPVVTRYLPQPDTDNDVIVEDGWASILTTGFDPLFGVHMVTSPEEWPTQMIPFIGFWRMQMG